MLFSLVLKNLLSPACPLLGGLSLYRIPREPLWLKTQVTASCLLEALPTGLSEHLMCLGLAGLLLRELSLLGVL